jgi:hypothetical protein
MEWTPGSVPGIVQDYSVRHHDDRDPGVRSASQPLFTRNQTYRMKLNTA